MLRTKHFVLAAAGMLVLTAAGRLRAADAPAHAEEAQKLTAVLQAADGSLFDKAKACQRLAAIGGKEAVPALAALLPNEQLSHYARYGLEPNPDPSTDAALAEAAGQLKGKLLMGVLDTIGRRRRAESVELLTKFLGNADPQVAAAAVAALGVVSGPKATDALTESLTSAPAEIRPAVADACLNCAQRLELSDNGARAIALYGAVRKAEVPKYLAAAALRGEILKRGAEDTGLLLEQLKSDDKEMSNVALRAAREVPGAKVGEVLVAELPNLPDEKKALVILVLGDRRDKNQTETVIKAVKDAAPVVRVAAIRALKHLGSGAAVPVLLEQAVAPEAEVAQAAQEVLATTQSDEVDEAILGMLSQGEAGSRVMAMRMAAERRIAAAVPALLKAADGSEPEVRLAAIRALGETVPTEALESLTARLLAAKSAEEKAAVQDALKATGLRMPDADAAAEKLAASLNKASLEDKVFLMELLSSVGGAKALETLAARARDGDDAVQDAATRVLGEWMSPDAGPVLMALAKSEVDNKYKIRALRGYIRIARQLELTPAERVSMSREAIAAAARPDEKRLALDVLNRNPSADALRLAVATMADAQVGQDAAGTAVAIAEKIVRDEPRAVVEAMPKVIEASKKADVKAAAEAVLKQAQTR